MATCKADGVELHWEDHGRGTPLLLLHGLGSSARDWEPQIAAFSERHRVIAFDLRGHGRSGRPADGYTMPRFARDARLVLDALGVERCDVLGLSLGGMIAFQLALDDPQRVRSLVIVNSGPDARPRELRWKLAVAYRRLLMAILPIEKLGTWIGGRLFPKPEQAALRRTFAERWADNDPYAYACSVRAILAWSVLDRIDDVRCPVLVVTGDRDYTPVALKRKYVDLLGDARLVVIPDSGHATPIDQPASFNRVVLDFLAERGAPDGKERVLGDAPAGVVPTACAV